MQQLLDARNPLDDLFELLAERSDEPSFEERYRAAHFVLGEIYGTRCSTVVLIDPMGNVTFAERSFDSAGRRTHEVRESFASGTAAGLHVGARGTVHDRERGDGREREPPAKRVHHGRSPSAHGRGENWPGSYTALALGVN